MALLGNLSEYKHNMAQLIIDMSGSKGLVPKWFGEEDTTTSAPQHRIIAEDGQMAEGSYNPFRKLGYMSPSTNGLVAVSTSTTPDAQFSASIYDEINDDAYFAEAGTRIFRADTLEDITLSEQHVVTGGTITDIEIYERNGVPKLYYTYKKTSSADDMGISDLPMTNESDTFLSGTTTNAFQLGANNHRMIVADNGFMYILDGNTLHKYDGTTDGGVNGTATANVLTFPSNFQLVDAADLGGNLWIAVLQNTTNLRKSDSGISFSNECGVYVWDRSSTSFNTRKFIPIKGLKYINNIYISPKGDVRLLVTGTDRIARIMVYNGVSFQTVQELGIRGYPTYADGIQVGNQMTFILTNTGDILAHGAIFPNKEEGLFKVGTAFTGSIPLNYLAGVLLLGDAVSTTGFRGGMYVNYFDNTSGSNPESHTVRHYVNGSGTILVTDQATTQGDVYTPVKYLPKMSTVNKIVIYMAPIATSNTSKTADIKIYFNGSTTAFKTQEVTRKECNLGYIDIPINESYVNSVQLEVEFNTAITVGSGFDFQPSVAMVDYTPTNTNK